MSLRSPSTLLHLHRVEALFLLQPIFSSALFQTVVFWHTEAFRGGVCLPPISRTHVECVLARCVIPKRSTETLPRASKSLRHPHSKNHDDMCEQVGTAGEI